MGILRSILITSFKNLTQLIFLAIITLLSVSTMMGFITTAQNISNERDKIYNSSNKADFSINLKNMQFLRNAATNDIGDYIDYRILKNKKLETPIFFDRDIYKSIRISYKNSFVVYVRSRETKKTISSYTVKYSDKENLNNNLSTLVGKSYSDIFNNENYVNDAGDRYYITSAEATALTDYLHALYIATLNYNFENVINKLSSNYIFDYIFHKSQVFNAEFTVNGVKKTAFVRSFLSYKDKNLPFNLHILEGEHPGYSIEEKFLSATDYDYKTLEFVPRLICDNIANKDLANECLISISTQIAMNSNFMNVNNLSIGDEININGIDSKIVGIGESSQVAFPQILPLAPIPEPNKNGVFWLYDESSSDREVTSELGIGQYSNTYKNGLFAEEAVFGRFLEKMTKSQKNNAIQAIKEEIQKLVSNPNEEFILSLDDPNFVGRLRIIAPDLMVKGFEGLTYAIATLLIIILVFISLLSTKSLIQETRGRLSIMKAIGYSRTFITFIYTLLPTIICVIATVSGYFLGVYFNQLLLSIVKPMLLNTISSIVINPATLALLILIPFVCLVTSTVILTFYLIKEPTSESLKLHDNKRPTKIYRFFKKFFPPLIRKSKIQISFLLSSFGKLASLVILAMLSTSSIFIATTISQVADDYAENYLSGKKYNGAVFYYQPTWNLPLTRYTLATEDDNLYNAFDLEKYRELLQPQATNSDLNEVLNGFVSIGWLKDKFFTVDIINKIDTLNFPEAEIGSFSFSYDSLREIVCKAILNTQWETIDKSEFTIGSCLNYLLQNNVPKVLQKLVSTNKKYPFSFARIDFDETKEELFTWAKYRLFGKNNNLNNLKNEEKFIGEGKMIGLGTSQRMVQLLDKNQNDLYSDLKNYWYNNINNLEANNIIPIVVNKTVAGKFNVKKGDYLRIDTLRTELQDVNTGRPLYGVAIKENGDIVKALGEFYNNSDDTYPDGRKYNYYYEKQAKDLQKVEILNYGGIVTLGWKMNTDFIDNVRKNNYWLVNTNDRITPEKSKSYYILGVTENFELDNNNIYTLQPYVNKNLGYPEVALDEDYPWFNGKYTDYVKALDDVYSKQACLTNIWGGFAHDFFQSKEIYNPLVPCVTDLEMKNLAVTLISALSSELNIFLYAILSLFCLLNIIVCYIVNTVAAKSMRKIIIIMRALGYKGGRILWTLSLSYIPAMILAISATLGFLYWFLTIKGHEFLINNLIDLPINIRWWYFLASGGAIFFLFIVLFIINFRSTLKKVTSEKKK